MTTSAKSTAFWPCNQSRGKSGAREQLRRQQRQRLVDFREKCVHRRHRWLEGQNLSRAKESLERVIADAIRACEVIKRVRALTSNATPERLEVNVNAVLKEVLAITRGELQARQVSLQLELNEDVPAVIGDKVQLQ